MRAVIVFGIIAAAIVAVWFVAWFFGMPKSERPFQSELAQLMLQIVGVTLVVLLVLCAIFFVVKAIGSMEGLFS